MAYLRFARPLIRNFPQQQTQEPTQEEVQEVYQEYVDERVSLFEELTPEQKIAQLMAYPLTIKNSDDEQLLNEKPLEATASVQLVQLEPGLITIFGSKISFEEARHYLQLIERLFAGKKTSPLFAVDHEGGAVQRFSGAGFTPLPSWREICAFTEQEQLILFSSSAQELQDLGVNIVFAPVVDINSSVLKNRTCTDFESSAITAKSYISAFGEKQIMPVIKHFPGLGQTTKDLHFSSESVYLAADDTLIFSRLLDAFPNIGVMSSHLQLKEKLDGLPCSMSAECLSVFEEEFPSVVIFTDALEMKALDSIVILLAKEFEFLTIGQDSETNTSQLLPEARLAVVSHQAIMAGNDVLVYGPDVKGEQLFAVSRELASHYQQDEEFAKKVDLSVLKLLAVKKINNAE